MVTFEDEIEELGNKLKLLANEQSKLKSELVALAEGDSLKRKILKLKITHRKKKIANVRLRMDKTVVKWYGEKAKDCRNIAKVYTKIRDRYTSRKQKRIGQHNKFEKQHKNPMYIRNLCALLEEGHSVTKRFVVLTLISADNIEGKVETERRRRGYTARISSQELCFIQRDSVPEDRELIDMGGGWGELINVPNHDEINVKDEQDKLDRTLKSLEEKINNVVTDFFKNLPRPAPDSYEEQELCKWVEHTLADGFYNCVVDVCKRHRALQSKMLMESEVEALTALRNYGAAYKLIKGYERTLGIRGQQEAFWALYERSKDYQRRNRDFKASLEEAIRPHLVKPADGANINVVRLFERGEACLGGKKNESYEGALECYEAVFDLEKDSARAWNNKGVVNYWLKDYAGARDCFNEALKCDGSLKDAERNLYRIMAQFDNHGRRRSRASRRRKRF